MQTARQKTLQHNMQDLSDKQRMEKQAGGSQQTRALTDRNNYPQNSDCDVVTYEVVITCSWKERRRETKNKTKKKFCSKTQFLKFSHSREKFEASWWNELMCILYRQRIHIFSLWTADFFVAIVCKRGGEGHINAMRWVLIQQRTNVFPGSNA